MKTNEFIAAEDKDGIGQAKSAVDCDTIETNGGTIDIYTLGVIQHAQQTRGAIVLTDPDFPDDKIRNTIRKYVSGVKHAYVDREKAKSKRGKIGIEHTNIKDIQGALTHVSLPLEEARETIDRSISIDLGLIIGRDARYHRNILGRKSRTGHSNGKQLLKKLNAFGYAEDDVKRALSEEEEN